jgi:hypothetical protein
MPAGTFELALCSVGSVLAASSVYFYRAKQTVPFKARLCAMPGLQCTLQDALASCAFWHSPSGF